MAALELRGQPALAASGVDPDMAKVTRLFCSSDEAAIASAAMPNGSNRVLDVLQRAARGEFPAGDMTVEVLPPPPGPPMAVVALAAHYLIATSAPEHWVHQHTRQGEVAAPMSPRFLTDLSERLGRRDDGIDVLLAAEGLAGRPTLRETGTAEHPRVLRECKSAGGARIRH